MELGSRIRALRTERQLSQELVAEQLPCFPAGGRKMGKAALPCPARPICLPYANYSACRPSSLLRRSLCSSQCIGAVRPHLCCSPWRSSCFSQGRRCSGCKASCRTASSAMPMPRPGCTLPVLPPCRFCCSAQERCWAAGGAALLLRAKRQAPGQIIHCLILRKTGKKSRCFCICSF